MKRSSPLFLAFSCSLLASGCPQGGDGGVAQPGPPEAASSSTSDPVTGSTADTPTTSGETTLATTAVLTTGSAATGTTATGTTSESSESSTSETDQDAGSSSSTTGTSTEECGNGELDPGEGCDEGYAFNSNNGACTLACQPAVCGDGHVWQDQEDCDNGLNNNDSLYDGCTTQCLTGPTCNDGEVQGPEECDLGADNGTGKPSEDGVPCDDVCRFDAKLVFVTSTLYTGGELGGAEGADLKCQARAGAAGFDNATGFKAYISDAASSPASDEFNHSTKPYVLPSGILVADDWDDLILQGPIPGITLTETGETLDARKVWTGTTVSGNKFPDQTCENWTNSVSGSGRVGLTSAKPDESQQWLDDRQWVSESSAGCSFPARLYCMEQ
jgi:hypothetical protein